MPGDRFRIGGNLGHRPGGHHVPAMLPGAGTNIHDPVGGAHRLFVVLDHDQRVADIAQPLQSADQARIIPLVEADARFVQDVEHAHQRRPDLRRQTDALRLTTRERVRTPFQGQVVQADINQEAETLPDLLENLPRDHEIALAQRRAALLPGLLRQPGEPVLRLADWQPRHLNDGTVTDGDAQHFRLQARALADRTWPLSHEALEFLFYIVRGCGLIPALQVRDHALIGNVIRAGTPATRAVLDLDHLAARAAQDQIQVFLRQLADRCVQVNLVRLGHAFQHGVVPGAPLSRGAQPWHDCPLGQREILVWNNQVRVELARRAQARAGGTGAVRRVEREVARLDLRQADHPVHGTSELLREDDQLAIDDLRLGDAAGDLQCRLDRLNNAQPIRVIALGDTLFMANDQAVDHHFDGVLLRLGERQLHRLVDLMHDAIDAHAYKALPPDLFHDAPVLALAIANHRGQDHQPGAVWQVQQLLRHLLWRLRHDRPATLWTVRLTDPREEQAHVVVDLGDRTNCRARVAAGPLLVDGDRRGKPLDVIDVRLLHLPEELTCVRRQ